MEVTSLLRKGVKMKIVSWKVMELSLSMWFGLTVQRFEDFTRLTFLFCLLIVSVKCFLMYFISFSSNELIDC